MTFHKFAILATATFMSVASMSASEPAGYYSTCEGKSGKALLQQLQSVIDDHTVVAYKNLYTVYDDSDRHPDGTIWDMYSTKNWGKNFNSVKCGNYSVVGDCINKEHSFPKSWFDDRSPMMSDAFHIYPTDGKVNGQRSNFPYGECANGSSLSSNGKVEPLGKLGKSTFPGYTGTVFEPDDKYKGDFARTYFYMAARYNSQISTWNSPMLANNNYPCFSSWALNLLLKWHEQDPVDNKETVRNDAVYSHQHNRNPFIDHPELVDYIWGDKQNQEWSLSIGSEPKFILPVDNSTLDMGLAGIGVAINSVVTVAGINLGSDATVSISGTCFSATPLNLAKTDLNAEGASLTISYLNSVAGKSTGKVVISSGDAKVTLNLKAESVDGLPVLAATNISSEAFTANWVSIDPAGTEYTLDVRRENVSIDGYPRKVDASAGSYRVTDLEPETAYTYTVSNQKYTSDVISVTTAAPIPSITFFYDDELSFLTTINEPSDIAEILVEIENIPGDVTIKVATPFELSLNKQEWGQSIVLAPGADRFYMRLNSSSEGLFSTSLTATAEGGFFNDDVNVEGKVTPAGVAFVEDFEKQIPSGQGKGYGELTYNGSASTWKTNGVYFEYAGSNSYPHTGNQAARFNKSGDRYIMMLENKTNGIGTVRLWGNVWKDDTKDCIFSILVSADNGATWENVGNVTVKANGKPNTYAEYTISVNRSDATRLQIKQTSGARCMIDDISISDFKASLQLTPDGHNYHSWDAYSVAGELVIENNDANNIFYVYSIDGREVFSGKVATPSETITLPAGLYVVNVCDFSRRVLVK